MMVGVYAVGYWLIARDPIRFGPFVYIGLLGKVLGPIGFLGAALMGTVPWSFGWINVFNDLVWLPPFVGFTFRLGSEGKVLWKTGTERQFVFSNESKIPWMKTRTGGFAIGFRRGGSDWQRNLPGLLEWSKQNDLGVIDIGNDGDKIGGEISHAGLTVGTADMPFGHQIFGNDLGKRDAALAQLEGYVKACTKIGINKFFTVLIPEDKARARSENFAIIAAALHKIAEILDRQDAHLVIEGWPGPGALACTPEGYRAVFKEVSSKSMAVNYDPSHLIRMGIDPIRFLEEFADRVKHVHGKDTELLSEGLYEYGHEQPPTFGKPHGFGMMAWRYTIPGHGVFRWTKGFEILKSAGYAGAVCIELEDENFNTDEAGEKQGILAGARFLESC